MNAQQINAAIIAGTFTSEELSSMFEAIKYNRSRLNHAAKRSLRIGDNVNFTNPKTGQNFTGVVIKIAVKMVTVRTVGGNWRVPAGMLEKVEEYA